MSDCVCVCVPMSGHECVCLSSLFDIGGGRRPKRQAEAAASPSY